MLLSTTEQKDKKFDWQRDVEPMLVKAKENFANNIAEWVPASQNAFDYFLNVLPPQVYSKGGFAVGEPYSSNGYGEDVHLCFRKNGSVYEARYLTIREFTGK